MEREYGIGRVPADVDQGEEQLAEVEATRIEARHMRVPDYPAGRKLTCGHVIYYRSHAMSASLGTVCPDCYDRYSD